MTTQSIPQPLPLKTAELAHQFGMIVAGVVALVARRFLRERRLMALTVPLCGWLGRTVQRLGRAIGRTAPRKATIGRTRAGGGRAPGAPALRLPSGRAWLVRTLGWEAAGFGLQLEHLLSTPDAQALLAARPSVGRILRPLCRMLGVPPALAAAPVVPLTVPLVVPVLAVAAAVEAGPVPLVAAVAGQAEGSCEVCSDIETSVG